MWFMRVIVGGNTDAILKMDSGELNECQIGQYGVFGRAKYYA